MPDVSAVELRTLLPSLADKFRSNLEQGLSGECEKLTSLEIRARACANLGECLRKDGSIEPHQLEICGMFDEVFSDIVISTYLSASGLDNPARVMLRRSLELGVAIAYLWDQPVRFYSWSNHDEDLSFKEMMEYFSSQGFATYVQKLAPTSQQCGLDIAKVNGFYRALSNTAHGKWTTLEVVSELRFMHNSKDLEHHLILVNDVGESLISIWKARFPEHCREVFKCLPSMIGGLA